MEKEKPEMETVPLKSRFRRLPELLPMMIFCGFIFAMAIGYLLLPKEEYSPQEKKKLVSFPCAAPEQILNGTFQSELDTFLSDHIPGRLFYAGLSADYELCSGRNGSKGIYLGADNTLYPAPAAEGNLLKNAGFIKEYAEDSDIPVYMTVIPSAGAIQEQGLPLVHESYRDRELIDSFRQALGDKVIFTDVYDHFKEAAAETPLYYRTDHHWNSRGAFEGYQMLCTALGKTPLKREDFSVETVDGFYGTSYSKSALWLTPPDSVELWSDKAQSPQAVQVEIIDGEDRKTGNSYFFREQLANDDKYPVFLDGNHSLVRITNQDAPDGCLVVVKDSYAHALVPFLSRHYRTIVMADLRYYKKDISALAEQEGADGVLFLYSLTNLSEDNNLSFLF